MVTGCSGLNYLFHFKILLKERAPQNGCFVHPFCNLYEYPCVQCRLEPVHTIDTMPNSPAGNKLVTQSKNNVFIVSISGMNPSQKRGHFTNYSAIRLNLGNPRSRAVYAKGKSTSANILKNFSPYFIKLNLWFYILRFVS